MAAAPEAVFFIDEIRSPVQVGDLAAALLELAEGTQAGILHVAGADALSRFELARLLSPHPERVRGAPLGDRPRPRNCALSSARARQLLRTRLRGAREVLD